MQQHPTDQSSDDEEAPPQYHLEETSSQQNMNDDREDFIDGVSVELWIVKTQEKAERNRLANVSSTASQSNDDGKSYGGDTGGMCNTQASKP
jgi:hypothetical protein